ncbi:hypothetical protein [Chamaesiphon sp.]|uniref:hypothetical protein n=1 Tax=Chamaesiphon sp. TaxID=2814140 RepID=UPI00359440F2
MLDKSVDLIGDWNPQLFKELKSRITIAQTIATLLGSVLMQVAIAIYFGLTETSAPSQLIDAVNFINWLIPIVLILGSIYTLVADLDREHRQGTLDFIRLTPQSARSIYLGKILGVPSSTYLGILATIPLHLLLGINAGYSLPEMLGWYGAIGMTTYFCLSLATLYTLSGGRSAILTTLLCWLPVQGLISAYNYYLAQAIANRVQDDSGKPLLSWFYLPIVGNSTFPFNCFIICTLAAICYWLWIKIDRSYINSASTSFTKEHSYLMNIQVQIWLLGFALPIATGIDRHNLIGFYILIAVFASISALWILTLVPLILPARQSTYEWNRDVREHISYEDRHWWQQDLVRDLIWHDRSPIVVAILLNLAIAATVWGLCFSIFIEDRQLLLRSICGIIIVSLLTLIYTTVVQTIGLRSSASKPQPISLIVLMSCLPLLSILMATISEDFRNLSLNLLLFSPLSWAGIWYLSLPNIGMMILGQIWILVGATKMLQRRLHKLVSVAPQPSQHQLAVGRTNI